MIHDATSHKATSSKHCLKSFGLMMAGTQVMQHAFLVILMLSTSTKNIKFVCFNAKSLMGILKS